LADGEMVPTSEYDALKAVAQAAQETMDWLDPEKRIEASYPTPESGLLEVWQIATALRFSLSALNNALAKGEDDRD
jgi:hypothetical protein